MTTVMYETPGTDLLSDTAVVPATRETTRDEVWDQPEYLAAYQPARRHRTYGAVRQFTDQDHTPDWIPRVVGRISSLLTLEADWDSYGARPIRPEVSTTVLQLLLGLGDRDTPEPEVYPIPNGGLQLEWDLDHMFMEIRVISPVRVEVSFELHDTGEQADFVVTSDFRHLAMLIGKLSSGRQ